MSIQARYNNQRKSLRPLNLRNHQSKQSFQVITVKILISTKTWNTLKAIILEFETGELEEKIFRIENI